MNHLPGSPATAPRFHLLEGEALQAHLDQRLLCTFAGVRHPYQLPDEARALWWALEAYKEEVR